MKHNDIIEIKQAFNPTLYLHIKEVIMSDTFQWRFLENTSNSIIDDPNTIPSFMQFLYLDNSRIFPVSYMVEAGLMCMLDSIGLKLKDLFRIRIGMMTKSKEIVINNPHVDSELPHMSALVYFSNSNAPTYLYDNFYDAESKKSSYDYMMETLSNQLKIEKEIPCIENTGVIFNGHRYHSSSIPTNSKRRVVINFNFTVY